MMIAAIPDRVLHLQRNLCHHADGQHHGCQNAHKCYHAPQTFKKTENTLPAKIHRKAQVLL